MGVAAQGHRWGRPARLDERSRLLRHVQGSRCARQARREGEAEQLQRALPGTVGRPRDRVRPQILSRRAGARDARRVANGEGDARSEGSRRARPLPTGSWSRSRSRLPTPPAAETPQRAPRSRRSEQRSNNRRGLWVTGGPQLRYRSSRAASVRRLVGYRNFAPARPPLLACGRGRSKTKREPCGSLVSTQIRPPIPSIALRTM